MTDYDRVVTYLRAHAEPEEPVEYLCSACSDTGFVEVDDGLEDGRRVRAPQVARCTSVVHTRPRVAAEPIAERFS